MTGPARQSDRSLVIPPPRLGPNLPKIAPLPLLHTSPHLPDRRPLLQPTTRTGRERRLPLHLLYCNFRVVSTTHNRRLCHTICLPPRTPYPSILIATVATSRRSRSSGEWCT